MIRPDYEELRVDFLQRRGRYRNVVGSLKGSVEDISDRAGRAIDRLRPRRHPAVTYMLPESGRLGAFFQHEEVFTHIPNPREVNLYEMWRDFFSNRENGVVFDSRSDRNIAFDTAHSRDLAREAVAEDREDVIRITGLEAVVSEVMKRATATKSVKGGFNSVEFEGRAGVSLILPDGTPQLVHELFGKVPRALPDGEKIRFTGKDRDLVATVLTTPSDIQLPYLCLLGSQNTSDGNLTDAMIQARRGQQRIVVVYKKGDEGIVRSFIKPHSGTQGLGPTDVYDVSEDRNRVVGINGQEARNYNLPKPKKGSLHVVTMSVEGGIEDYITGKRKLPPTVRSVKAIFGLDPVQTGNSMMNAGLMPFDFRGGVLGNHFRPHDIARMYREDRNRFYRFIRLASLFPVHIVALQTERHKK